MAKRALLFIAALAGLNFGSANAALTSPSGGNLGVLDPSGALYASSGSYNGIVTGGAMSFDDVVTFSVLGVSSAANSVTSSISGGSGFASFATELWSGGSKLMDGTSVLLSSAFWVSTFSYTPLNPSTDYSIHIRGATLGNSLSATYGGSVTVSPVPEPQTYAMLLAGLSLMGFVVARRRSMAHVASPS